MRKQQTSHKIPVRPCYSKGWHITYGTHPKIPIHFKDNIVSVILSWFLYAPQSKYGQAAGNLLIHPEPCGHGRFGYQAPHRRARFRKSRRSCLSAATQLARRWHSPVVWATVTAWFSPIKASQTSAKWAGSVSMVTRKVTAREVFCIFTTAWYPARMPEFSRAEIRFRTAVRERPIWAPISL